MRTWKTIKPLFRVHYISFTVQRDGDEKAGQKIGELKEPEADTILKGFSSVGFQYLPLSLLCV